MSAQTISRSCFVCGSSEGETTFRAELDVCGLGQVTYGIRCCSGCGLTLQDPAVSPETMMRQYGMFSNYTAFSTGEPPLSPTAARMLKAVETEGIRPGFIYDVGASTGAMLWHFRRHGWTVGGCDLSAKAVEQAKELNDITVDTGSDEDTLVDRKDLDLITFSHVMEHIYHPPTTLRRVRDALADDGLLMFEVPCLAAPEVNPPGLFMMEHINYFDESSVENLLGRNGFTILQANVTLDHFPFPVITVLARKSELRPDTPVVSGYEKNLSFCHAYTAAEKRRWDAVDAGLRAAIDAGEEVYIWGAGLHTSSLLANTGLAEHATIVAITDRDPQKHGHTLGPHAVVAPDEALAAGRKIVVSSYVSEREIAASLERSGIPADRIVRPHAGVALAG